ncbi:MAG: cache domain-containing protein [Acidobacteriia bacterium]|nr:cache domain-containing protein [Terriglobia bacterium]
MLSFLRDLSLRVKITLAFILLVLLGASVSITIGSGIITRAMLGEAQKRVSTGLETARMMYELRLDRARQSVVRCSASAQLLRGIAGADREHLPGLLASLRADNALDFAGFVDARGRLVTSSGSEAVLRDAGAREAMLRSALAGETVSGTLVLDARALELEGNGLSRQALLPIVRVPRSRPVSDESVDRGPVLFAAAPVRIGSRIVGAAYGGVLISRNTEVVNQVKLAVFGNETFDGRPVGAVSIFLGDVRVSTTETSLGSQVSSDVAAKVLDSGVPWFGPAFVVKEWFITAYEPLRDPRGRIVGMLGVGVREDPYLALRTRVMLTFLVVACVGVLIVFGLTYVIARAMVRPLAVMAGATRRIATGDLDHTVPVTSGDEIGTLAVSFNAMVASLRVARDELEQWTQTLEDKVRERTAELVQMQSKMVEAERMVSLGRMAAGVAHEINNPMGGILTFATLGLEDLPADHPQRRNFEIIVKQTLRCRDIVKGLLEFSRQSESKPTLTDVDEVVDKTLMLLQQQASFQNIRTTRVAGDSLPPILIDPGHLQQVVLNLVVNAVDAMEEKGELTVVTERSFDGREVCIRIKDTGKGISGETLPLIFEPFFTTKEVGRGTGLGLAIVHGIVTRAGGRVEVGTSPGGTTFTVRFPASDAPQSVRAETESDLGLA